MKGKARLLMVLAALGPLCLQARGIADVIETLGAMPPYNSSVTYSVTLPNRDNDVVYNIDLSSTPAPTDTLSPCSYLIVWSLDTPSGPTEGWTSYFNGNLYNYRNNRLREYHTDWDTAPFSGTKRQPGIQASAQFTELLPAYIARELKEMTTDSLYTVSNPQPATCDGQEALRIDAEMNIRGECVKQISYWLDATTLTPLRIDIESNPASITEQSISVHYTHPQEAKATPESEDALLTLYPEHFEKYRESNFRIENLRDTPLPTFTLPTADGQRYTHHRGESFDTPVIVALIDPTTSFCPKIIRDVRAAIDSSTVATEILWAVATTNPDKAEETIGQLRSGERLLLNARSLARDCGATSLPVVILAARDGNVKNVILGYNPDITNVVVQSIALM